MSESPSGREASLALPHDSLEVRLMKSRKQWRRDHPFGFFAKPVRTAQGVLDLKKWECGVPGKDKTLWEGGLFKLDVLFPDGKLGPCKQCTSMLTYTLEYPTKPPKCMIPGCSLEVE